MAGDRVDIYSPAQLEMWKLLGDTKAVVDATGDRLVRPGKVVEPHAKGPASLDAQKKGRGNTRAVLDLGKVPAPGRTTGSGAAFPQAGAAKGKQRLTIAKARWGNRSIVVRRD